METLRATVAEQAVLSGANAGDDNCLVFRAFQWARSMSDFQLLETDEPIFAWRDKMLDQFGGLARSAPGYAF